jgi:hypothetical protein
MREQVDRKTILPDANLRLLTCVSDHGTHHLAARGIPKRMHNTCMGVTALQPKRHVIARLVEHCAPPNQFVDPDRCHLNDVGNHLGIAQSLTGRQCIRYVIFKRILRVENPRDSALRKAAEIVAADAPIVPLYLASLAWAAKKGLTVIPRRDEETHAMEVHVGK